LVNTTFHLPMNYWNLLTWTSILKRKLTNGKYGLALTFN
jgi:hypothetical protein